MTLHQPPSVMMHACSDMRLACNLDLNNVAPKCRVVSLQRLETIPSIVE